MPKITENQIIFLPEDRWAVEEVSQTTTLANFNTLFAQTKQGIVQNYFKFLEEIAAKDPDIIQALESRTSEIVSKEWIIEGTNAEELTEALKAIKGDKLTGLLTFEELIDSLLGASYLTGIAMNEIVADESGIAGFNKIPGHFLTYQDEVFYPKLWTQEHLTGIAFNYDKMIYHVLNPGTDPVRGYLGQAVAIQYLLKLSTLEDRIRWQGKYGKGFLLVTLRGSADDPAYDKDYEVAAELVDDIYNTDGVVLSNNAQAQMVQPTGMTGDYFFTANDDYKKNIVKIILGQTSTSDSDDSNRSTAEVHMDVLDQRVMKDMSNIEDTINSQLLPKIKDLLGLSDASDAEFQFVRSDMEQAMDEDADGAEAQPDKTQVIEESQGE